MKKWYKVKDLQSLIIDNLTPVLVIDATYHKMYESNIKTLCREETKDYYILALCLNTKLDEDIYGPCITIQKKK